MDVDERMDEDVGVSADVGEGCGRDGSADPLVRVRNTPCLQVSQSPLHYSIALAQPVAHYTTLADVTIGHVISPPKATQDKFSGSVIGCDVM